ncbi:MAG: methylmalonyl Co-A mutase-associated GTPase MeaB [Acidobacteriota bacterium]|nr:methylmalonyl Co-A mutase-associated GTPase MeaB [Acidobacteriota bacterium]MDH3785901.1 methylmalonyl Co-A mutase-associated GTPase MeaB [Acidobacteriota bacterium]
MSRSLADRVLAGETRALARAITMVEENAPAARDVLRAVFSRTGRASVIGLTGSPGAGKSSLVDQMIKDYRAAGKRVGVVAVDPSSAYSGGAILGDRVRMQEHAMDADVFIRSMATRGHLGGLSRTTNDAIDLMDAAGYDPILVETVGVGQDEVEVVKTADSVVVVLVPGMGDDIQAIKAGILEIADIFVINKSDRPGADRLDADLKYMLSLVDTGPRPRPPILKTVAVTGEGIPELQAILLELGADVAEQGRRTRSLERASARLHAVLTDRLLRHVLALPAVAEEWDRSIGLVAERQEDPYSVVDRLMRRIELEES